MGAIACVMVFWRWFSGRKRRGARTSWPTRTRAPEQVPRLLRWPARPISFSPSQPCRCCNASAYLAMGASRPRKRNFNAKPCPALPKREGGLCVRPGGQLTPSAGRRQTVGSHCRRRANGPGWVQEPACSSNGFWKLHAHTDQSHPSRRYARHHRD